MSSGSLIDKQDDTFGNPEESRHRVWKRPISPLALVLATVNATCF